MIFTLTLSSILHAEQEESSQGMPPAKVVVSEVSAGMIAPQAEFIGTVYYQEVSDVASEVEGLVEAVSFEEGERLKKGHVLVMLSSDLLKKTIQATRASYEQVLSDLDKAKLDLKRAENLFKNQLVTEETYDERRFAVSGLEKKAISLEADVGRLEVELQKKSVKSPFDGIVIKKHVDRGEWLSAGSTVVTLGKDDVIDIMVEIPENLVKHTVAGMAVDVMAGGGEMSGKIVAIIPRGDIATRTIPVKIRAANRMSLIEGMEARVRLPAGEKRETLAVHRDAVITAFGDTVVFAVNDSSARMIPVKVIGYKGLIAGIASDGLKEGMRVVIKGNERLMDGQAVIIQE